MRSWRGLVVWISLAALVGSCGYFAYHQLAFLTVLYGSIAV